MELPAFFAVAVWPALLRSTQSQCAPCTPASALAQLRLCCANVIPAFRGQTSAWPSTSVTRDWGPLTSMSSTVPRTPIEAVGVEMVGHEIVGLKRLS